MTQDDIIERVRHAELALRASGVAGLFLFGSHVRGEATAASDIDIFVDPEDRESFGFDSFMDSYEALQHVLPGREIGYSTRDGLGKYFRAAIEQEAIRVF